jgi:hypothetical protein
MISFGRSSCFLIVLLTPKYEEDIAMTLPSQYGTILRIYLEHLRTHEQMLSEEHSLLALALATAQERYLEIQRGEHLRALSRSTGQPEAREEALRECTLVLQHLEEEKAWLETQAEDLEVRQSIWQTLLSGNGGIIHVGAASHA